MLKGYRRAMEHGFKTIESKKHQPVNKSTHSMELLEEIRLLPIIGSNAKGEIRTTMLIRGAAP